MNRNTELHFSQNPTNIDIPRSKFKINHDHKTTLNTGDLVPIGLWETLPGDTAKIDLASLVRMTTPIYPVMDNAYMDIYFFSVPNRLVWEHWKEFMGENTSSYWTQTIDYTIPQVTAPTGGWKKGSIANYLGMPIGVSGISVSALPFRAVALCYNEWFRDENLIEPCDITMGDATTAGSNGTDYVTDVQKGGMPPKVAKYADYFTSALPEPQKGPDVFIPISGQSGTIGGNAIVHTAGSALRTRENTIKTDGNTDDTWRPLVAVGKSVNGEVRLGNSVITGLTGNGIDTINQYVKGSELTFTPTTGTQATINQLRQAFAVQRMYEKDARGGTRYTEMIRAHFAVISPDARQQRPEYLGGKRIPINITQVLQQSSTNDTSPMGQTAAYSLTIDNQGMFTKSFTEHGHIIAFACIRTDHTYQQGIERMWSRKNRTDYYFPTLANIGEQYIKNKEIYAQGTSEDEEAFGYQEAWAEYRYKPSRISGELQSTYTTPLDSWHYGDKYTKLPVLGKDWINETKENVARTLAVTTQDQFIADFYFETTWTRPMPIYSIPGLLDHH